MLNQLSKFRAQQPPERAVRTLSRPPSARRPPASPQTSSSCAGSHQLIPPPVLKQPIRGVDLGAVFPGLTARQRDVLAIMLQGKSNKAICRALDLAEQTVKGHVSAILKALKVTNRTEAVIKVNQIADQLRSITFPSLSYQLSLKL